MEKYFAINKDGLSIRCKLYHEKSAPIQKVVLYVHGFAGDKDNASAKKLAGRILSKYKGIAVLLFDLPCHGDDVKKKLLLDDCIRYTDAAVDYCKTVLHAETVSAFGVSFGGYLILKYIAENGCPFAKIVLRCPAVNMAEVLTQVIITEEESAQIQKGRNVPVGLETKVPVTRQLLEELAKSDVQTMDFLDFADRILIIHGTADEVVPFEASRRFAENNVIEFVPVEGADHRFLRPSCMETVLKESIAHLER